MNPFIKTAVTTLVAWCIAMPALGEEQAVEKQAPPKPVCETLENFNDFDFWLGEWTVYSNDDARQLQGTGRPWCGKR